MKRLYLITAAALLLAATSCHKPEYVLPTADRQGLTSLTAIFTFGPYVDQELAKLTVEDGDAERFEIPVPFYFPETSFDETLIYMTKLRVQAELQPNFKITPGLGILDLTEENWFELTDPQGNTRKICITGSRKKGTLCDLVTFSIDELSVSGIVYKDGSNKLQIPYMDDLSEVSVSAQVSPHAKLDKINGKPYVKGGKYNMNTGATVSVLAHDGTTSKTYTVEQSIPDLLDMGLRMASVEPLFNLEAVSMLGLPSYSEEAFVSLAVNDSKLAICTGSKSTPIYINGYNGSKIGEVALGSAVADVIANDEGGHVLYANFAQTGSESVNIYSSTALDVAPTLLATIENPLSLPVGHRMKVVGDVSSDAVIVLTAEGVAGVTTASQAVVLTISGGALASTDVVDFAENGLGWGSAPVGISTVVPASLTPFNDGWYVDYYDGNADTAIADEDSSADAYILHHISAKGKDSRMALVGNWGNNPNCLDLKKFNNSTYLSLFVVSHFPHWGIDPRLYLYDATSVGNISEVMVNKKIKNCQTGTYNSEAGAAGDVAMWASPDGYRFFVFYYDHHCQTVGGYVADCFNI